MNPSDEISRIQSYLRENARSQYESLALPPFTLFFHPRDTLKYFNYAIPDEPIHGDLSGVLAELKAEYRRRGRLPRFEFFEAFAQELPAMLRASGFVEEERNWSMLCTPASFRPAPPVAGVTVVAIGPDSGEDDLRDFTIAQRQGFDPTDTSLPSGEEIAQKKLDFSENGWRGFLARVDGEPAGVSVYGKPIAGVSEIAGIATREAFRRRGIAALLTEYAVRAAFARGVQTACLTAADERAGRVYERVGFRPFSTMLAYIAEDEPSAA